MLYLIFKNMPTGDAMSSNELFWATGIDNTGLQAGASAAITIFQNLSTQVNGHLQSIIDKYGQVAQAANVKFTNPVDPAMISEIQNQITSLGKTIDLEIQKLGNFSAKYDQSMTRISKSASKLQVGAGSPLAPMVAGIQADVAKSSEQLSFMERRFKYAFGSMLAYGSMRILKTVSSDIIEVKTQFEFLQTAINSFAGSAEKGAKIMHELTQFAVNSPLQVNDITEAAKQLMAFGIEADNVVGQIKMLSDVAAGAGKPIKDIAYIYGKSLTEGKVYTRTLMQFGNLGIPIYKALADVMDTTPSKIKKMTQMGAIGFDDIKRAIESLTSAGGQYYAFSDKMMSTTAGLLSNLKDKWILAMKDMGESNDGMINSGVRGIDYLIAHWKELGETIVVVATAIGSYQVAKMVVGWGNQAATASANLAETASLETLISAEARAGIAKQGLVVGSIEYQAAIRKEIASLLESSAATITNATANEEAAVKKLLSAEATLATASASKKNAAQSLVDTTTIEANIAARNVKTAVQQKEILTTGIATAATAGEAAGTDLIALAKIRLTAITATLNKTIMANPYAAAFVAIATLVSIMWALHDSTTATERAQNALKKSMDDLQSTMDARIKKFTDLLDIVKNSNKSYGERTIAFNKMKAQYGDMIGDLTQIELAAANATDMTGKYANKVFAESKTDQEKILNAKRAELAAAKKEFDEVSKLNPYQNTNTALRYSVAQKQLAATQDAYKTAEKNYKDFTLGLSAQRTVADKKEEDDSYKHWATMKSNADTYIKEAGLKVARGYKAGTLNPKDTADYKQQLDNIVLANKMMAEFPDTNQNKAANKAAKSAIETANVEASAAQKRIEDIKSNNDKIIQLKDKSETDLAQATIDAMDAGYAKEKATQQNNFDKKTDELKKQGAELLKLNNKNIEDLFINANPNYKKEGKKIPTADNLSGAVSLLSGMPVSDDQKAALASAKQALITYSNDVDAVGTENASKMSNLLTAQLKEYGDYTAKKIDIEKKYNSDIAQLELDRAKYSKEGNTDMVARIDAATIQAGTTRAKNQMGLAFDQLKSTPEFAMAFEDLNNVSTDTIEKLIGKMEDLKQSQSGAMSLANYKIWAKEIEKLTDKFIERNPFKVLKENADELIVAQDELNQAKAYQGMVASGVKISDNGALMPISGVEQEKELAKAIDNVAKKTDNLTEKQNKGVKATKEITDAYGKLSSEMSALGDTIGGTAGAIISSIGQIGSFVTTSITAWKAASVAGAGAIQTVEKASIILGAISLVISIATAIVNIFTEASKAREEEAQKEIETINSVKKAYLDAYAAMTNKKFENIFGDDVWGKATAQAGLMKQAADDYDSAHTLMVDANSKTPNSSVWYDFITKELDGYLKLDKAGAASVTNFDVVKAKLLLADPELPAAQKALIQGMIDDWDAYQSYLDSLDSYLSSIFGELGSNIMDSLVADAGNMTAWADDVTGYISDSFTQMVKDLIFSMDFAADLAAEKKKIEAILADKTTTDAQKEALMQKELLTFKDIITADGKKAITDWETFKTSAGAVGFNLGGDSTNPNDLTSAIKSMDQPTADILTAQFSAMRIHTSNMDVNLSRYLPELLLSLQGQAGILQIAFNDVAEIKKNTSRLFEVADTLMYLKTYGIKAL